MTSSSHPSCPKYCIIFQNVILKSLKTAALCMMLVFICLFSLSLNVVENSEFFIFFTLWQREENWQKDTFHNYQMNQKIYAETHSKPSNDLGETDHISEISYHESLDDNIQMNLLKFRDQCMGDEIWSHWDTVTSLITRVDSADLAVQWGAACLPHTSICVHPKAECSAEEDGIPW